MGILQDLNLTGLNIDNFEPTEDKAVVQAAAPSESIEELVSQIPEITYDEKKVFLSQSMLKAWEQRECNSNFVAKWFKGVGWDVSTASQDLGKRFESVVLGATASGKIEPPLLTSKGVPTAEEKRIQVNAPIAKSLLKTQYPKGGEAQVLIEVGNLKGTIDYLPFDGAIMDLKYSGLLCPTSNSPLKWRDFVWYYAEDDSEHPKHISKYEIHQTQAKHYSLLVYLTTGDIRPFIFWVFDNRKGHEKEYQIFRFDISEDVLKFHVVRLIEAAKGIKEAIENKSINNHNPSFLRCQKCPINKKCTAAQKEPQVIVIDL